MDEDMREENPATGEEPEQMRVVGLDVFCYPGDADPSTTHVPAVQHPYIARVDLRSVNAVVYGYGDTPQEAFTAAKLQVLPRWRGVLQQIETYLMRDVKERQEENGTNQTVRTFASWQVPESSYPWPASPMGDYAWTPPSED